MCSTYLIDKLSSKTFEVSGGSIVLCCISFSYENTKYFTVLFGGNALQTNDQQKLIIAQIYPPTSDNVTFTRINEMNKYNQFVITNNVKNYGIAVHFQSIYGTITPIT